MKICFVCPRILPLFGIAAESEFGGAEVQIHSLARYLVRHGFEVDILVSTMLGRDPKMVDGIRLVPAVDDTPSGTTLSRISLVRALRRSRADAYVGTCAGPEIGVVSLFARLSRRPFIYRVSHEKDCDGSFERQHGWRGRLFGIGLRSADAVVAQHEDQRRQLEKRGIRAEVIQNGFELKESNGPAERDIDVLWVGRCDTWKRPELFLQLAQSLPDRRFAMICPPSQGRHELFEAIRSAAGGIANLTFVERVAFTDSQAYFERANVFVGTSEAEGFPNAYIQACIAGTPIAAYEVDPEKSVELNHAGFVAHGDFDRLKDGIERLLGEPTEWEKCSNNARAYARRAHDIEVEGDKWVQLLRSLQGRMLERAPGRADAAERELT